MKEQVEDIANSIKRHRNLELSVGATNAAVGRAFTMYNNEEHQFWITTREATVVSFSRDINGNVIPNSAHNKSSTYKGDGFPVPRDSKLGGLLIQNHEGKHQHNTPNGTITIEIFNRASYTPSDYDGEYATDIIIKFAGDSRVHTFQSIAMILALESDILKEKEKLERASAKEAEELIKRIEQKEEERSRILSKARGFIRRYAQLRHQPILDPIQDAVRRSNPFKGCLIINGGPGTGKTTSLIQRIKYLISPTIEEEVKLTKEQKDVLFNQEKSWVFYSPNELLALFLRNSMQREELHADNNRVKVWSSHKNELIKAYKLVDTTTQKPFLFYNKTKRGCLIKNTPVSVKNIISQLLEAYLKHQSEKIKKVRSLSTTPFYWAILGDSIIAYLEDKRALKSITDYIGLFGNLQENYEAESKKISDDFFTWIKVVAARIQVEIVSDEDRMIEISELLNSWSLTNKNVQEDENDTETDIDDFGEEDEVLEQDLEKILFNKLKVLCRKIALKKFDKNTRLTKRDKELLKLIPEANERDEYDLIGQAAFYKKYIERITKGIARNAFREIPSIYKKLRKDLQKNGSKHLDIELLSTLVASDNNSRIHPDEQALLLYFINSIGKALYRTSVVQYNTLNQPFVAGYRSNAKPVIGIDEATDFSLIDLLSIYSLGHPSISSITMSGDELQRMTSDGLRSWGDFKSIIKSTDIKDLKVSYRQSPTLLSLAKKIYLKATGKEATYEPFVAKDDSEPKPLVLVSESEEEKFEWIAQRIIEIYKAYGDSIPSIAIFLPNEDFLESFAYKLGQLDVLADVGIEVKSSRNGEVLGDKDTVRVFSLDKIKGLEFEAVFFHDLDTIEVQQIDNDLLLKYLYVGLSRATFYMGLTLKRKLSGDLEFLSDIFDSDNNTW